MNGWSPKNINVITQVGQSALAVPVTEGISISAGGALNFRVNISSTVSAGQITYILQQKVNSTWTALASTNSDAVVTSTGDVSIKMSCYVSADHVDLPLSSSLRVAATTNGSYVGSIDSIQFIQEL
jgi:hypothetical protein